MAGHDPYKFSELFRERSRRPHQDGAAQSTTAAGKSRPDPEQPHANTSNHTGPGIDEIQEHKIVHVRPGEMYRAFIRLVHRAATAAQTHDESLPELSADVAPYRYIIIRSGQQTPQKDFCSDMDPGMLVRRVCITKPVFYNLKTNPHDADVEISMSIIQRRGVGVHRRVAKAWLSMFPHGWARAQRLTPAAVPVSLVPHIAEHIVAYNSSRPNEEHLRVYLEDAFRRPAAAVAIQSAWRSYFARQDLNLTERTLRHRAALCIQRAWRSHLFLSHLRCMDAASTLMDSMAALTLIPTLCLTLLSARMLGLAAQRRSACLPLQHLQWGYMSEGGGIVLLAHSKSLRPGVPKWLNCDAPVVPWELVSVRGHQLIPDHTPEDRRKMLQLACWAPLKWLANDAGLVDLRYPPSGARECVSLLQKSVRVKQVQGTDVSESDIGSLMTDSVLRMLTFRSREEAMRRALLLFFVTWDPAYDQAAELVPISLSTAMAKQQAGVNNALYGDGDDSNLPPAYMVASEADEPLRRRAALVIALSLPGASKLAPYIHSIAGGHTSTVHASASPGDPPGTARRKSIVQTAPRVNMSSRASTFRFLQTVPDSFVLPRQDEEHNLMLQVDRGQDAGCTPHAGTLSSPITPEGAPQNSAKAVTAATPKHVHAAEDESPAADVDDLVLSQTSSGYMTRASKSLAETEIRHIITELGPEVMQQSSVYRALAGAFGRLQQSEHEAFLKIRTADLLTRKRVIVEAVKQMPTMMPRPTAVGHSLAPWYVPATMASMARSVETLKLIWIQRNTSVVEAIKQAQNLALESMHREVAARCAARYHQRCQDRALAAAVFAQNVDVQQDAARLRAAAVRARKERSKAVCCSRTHARAVGASLAAEARAVKHAERYSAIKQAHDRQRQEAEARWVTKLEHEEEVDANRAQQYQLKRDAAATVRASGYTLAVHQVYVDKAQESCEQAAKARHALYQGKAMVGAAGGEWGSCPPQVLREPYPTATIVAAAENEESEHVRVTCQLSNLATHVHPSEIKNAVHAGRRH